MAERCLLHKNKLDLLKWWLSSKGYEIQATKGEYEVLRAKKYKDTVIIFEKNRAKEHLTVQQKDHRLVRQFIKENNLVEAEKAYKAEKCPFKKTNYEKIKSMSVEKMARLFYEIIHARDLYLMAELKQKGIDASLIEFSPETHINYHKQWLESEVEEE